MDPVTLVVLGIVTLAVAPKVGSLAIYGGMKLVKSIKKKMKKRKEYKLRHNKKYQEKLKNTRAAQRAIEQRRAMTFKNTKTGAVKNVNIREENNFDMNKDIILKGKVKVQNTDGSIAEDIIYLFQPRVFGLNNVPIGPKLDKNGHLYDNNAYLLRTPGDPDIYSGYFPKREVLTGRQFDFVSDSVNANLGNLKGFIDIVIEKDDKGNFIPLDKNNVQEMNEFKRYIQMQSTKSKTQDQYLDDLVSKANDSYEAYREANKPRYAKPTEQMSEEEIHKIQKSRASQAKREAQKNAYYDRIAHMNMMDSVMHDHGLDEHAAHLPGAGMMGPRPMGPGPGQMGGGPAPGGRKR